MSNHENIITVIGNLTRDPELRYTTGGVAVCNFSVAQTPRRKTDQGWEDGDTSFFNCAAWRELGEHFAESCGKGLRVWVVGRMVQRDWEDKEGNKRTSYDIEVDDCGPSLRWGSATFTKSERTTKQQAPRQSTPPPYREEEEPF